MAAVAATAWSIFFTKAACKCRIFSSTTTPLLSTTLVGGNLPLISQTRNATKKAGGSVKRQNHNRKRKGKRYGPKVDQGELVQPGAILFRQKGFRMHPGRNVDYGKDHTLFALREGNVAITKELVERPQWFKWGEGPYFERTFIHVEERPKVRRIICKNPESLAKFYS
ncbi:uncharacterized protein [Clytia hemisphaerica]|uniref:uncharacterized protein n=1 Tax=Clytia hemisphaerica TaxID=252671 RepID=UPI0034D72A0F